MEIPHVNLIKSLIDLIQLGILAILNGLLERGTCCTYTQSLCWNSKSLCQLWISKKYRYTAHVSSFSNFLF